MFFLAWAAAATLSLAVAQTPTVTIVATDPDAAETFPNQPRNPGEFLLSRTGDASSALTVAVRLRGDAVQGLDYRFASPVTSTFTIPANAGSLTIPVYPIDDAVTEPDERVEIEILNSPGNAYILGAESRARLAIHDNDDPNLPPRTVVSVIAIDPDAAETSTGFVNTATFRIMREVNTNVTVEVIYRLRGTAVLGADYTAPSSVSIPAGAFSSDVIITPIDDRSIEATESVTLDLQDPVCVAAFPPPPECYVIGSPASATIAILDNEIPPPPPALTLNVTQDTNVFGFPAKVNGSLVAVAPTSHISSYEIRLNGTLMFSDNTDYLQPPAPGVPFEFNFFMTNLGGGSQIVQATVTDDQGLSTTIERAVFIVAIQPPPPPRATYSIVALDSDAAETLPGEAPVSARFLFTQIGTPGELEFFSYSFIGSAREGVDYTISYGPAISATNGVTNILSQEITINPVDDLLVEGIETVKMQLCFPIIVMVYGVGAPIGVACTGDVPGLNATINILDNDTEPPPVPIITIAATDPVAAEVPPELGTNDTAVFTVTRHGPTEGAVTVHYAISAPPRVQNGVDYEELPGIVTIPAGATSVDIILKPIFDLFLEGDEAVLLTLLPSPLPLRVPGSYLIDTETVASMVIHDYAPSNIPVVTIWANDPQAIEDPVIRRNGSFIVQRSGNTNDSITVYYDIGGSASNGFDYAALPGRVTIGAASRGVQIPVVPIADSINEGIEAVGLTLQAPPEAVYSPPYLIGNPHSAGVSIQDRLRRARPALLPGGFFVVPLPTTTPCCVIEASSNLVDWQQIGITDASQAAGEIDQFIDVDATAHQMRFYRTAPCPSS
ncbi:MAG TPA: Calx-beta domain-containing protein, partial [Verrucomicrobiae bacterium]|nr:Calx-beta domain-containing protein [Verrucomicrobiae bacterium]